MVVYTVDSPLLQRRPFSILHDRCILSKMICLIHPDTDRVALNKMTIMLLLSLLFYLLFMAASNLPILILNLGRSILTVNHSSLFENQATITNANTNILILIYFYFTMRRVP